MHPLEIHGHLLMDGGVVSNLPIEPALAQGATEIIALDITDPRELDSGTHGFGPFLEKLTSTVEQRQLDLELALAEARGVPVHLIALRAETPVPLWDFSHADALIVQGYEIARQEIARWRRDRRAGWHKWLARLSR
jgi:NTE family protein